VARIVGVDGQESKSLLSDNELVGPGRRSYRFDDITVVPDLFHIEKGGEPLALEPKGIRVLIFLVEHRDRVVSKEELLQAVWPDTSVTDNALTRVIAQLRKTLGDNAREARYIETAATLGYRFVAKVSVAESPSPRPRLPRWVAPLALAVVLVVLLGAAVALWNSRRRAEGIIFVRHLEQITRTDSCDQSPSFSPDGSAIAYSSDRGGTYQVYVRSFAAGAPEIQLTKDERQNVQPDWSPDGRHVAYLSVAARGIFVLPALGGTPARLTTFGSQPAWSPDGNWIVFRSQNGTFPAVPDWPSTIWKVAARGGMPEEVTSRGKPPGRHGLPRFSPDGRRLAFLSYRTTTSPDLWTLDLATREAAEIRCPFRIVAGPRYSLDGRAIYVAGESKAAELGIWRIPVDPGSGRIAGNPLEITRTGSAEPASLALTRDGKRLAYAAQTQRSTLQSLPLSPATDLPTGPSTQLTSASAGRQTMPAFSPDGTRIAWFMLYQGSHGGQIWLAQVDGSGAAPLVTGLEAPAPPKWMPDGQTIRYTLAARSKVSLWSVGLADRMPQRLWERPLVGSGFQELSPDGRELAFWVPKDGVPNIWKAPVAAGAPVQLTFEREPVGFPYWSPDGKWILVNLTRGPDKHAGVISSSGGPVKQLTAEPGFTAPTCWSPDSSKIAFGGYRDGVWNLYWVSRATKEVRRLTNLRSASDRVGSATWSPKRDRIVYERTELRANIFLLDLAGAAVH
jgi:Tol biopolymer transport system component/DNA-binding winged helix-turn-helix (wHTH) protein